MTASTLTRFFARHGAWMTLLVALVATLGSLYFSEVRRYVPCSLCWYQRILMYPLAVIALIGLVERDEFLPRYVLPFSVVGVLVAGYHVLLQWGVLGSDLAMCSVGVPCNGRFISWLGFITIPALSLTAFILITIIMAFTQRAYSRRTAES